MKVKLDAELARRLVAAQFPQWADLPVRPVENGGRNNKTFHLGETMSIRLPRAYGYAAQVDKEQRWLPVLAPQLPVAIPEPLALGQPGEGYPWRWSIYRWIEGETANAASSDLVRLAGDVAAFLNALQRIDATDGPPPGPHNFFRAAPPAVYDAQTREALVDLEGEIDVAAATEVWEAALAADWPGPPVWVHGDIAAGNLLVRNARLAAVIDFGILGVGDPACDLAIAWTLFEGESREAFRAALPLDPGTWARGRGWTLWKALIIVAGSLDRLHPGEFEASRRQIDELIEDHRRFG